MSATLATRYRGRLRSMNIWAGVWHLCLSLVIVITVISVGSPFNLRISKLATIVNEDLLPPAFRSIECTDPVTNVTKAFDNVFDYVRCVAPLQVPLKTELQNMGTMQVWILLLVFELVTAFSHFRLVYFDQQYHELLQHNLNPARWREYSITNTLMLVSILSLSGLSEIYLLLHIALCAIFMNYVGGLVFELLTAIEEYHALKRPVKALVREAKLVILLLAWAAFALSLVYLYDTFNTTTSTYYRLETGTLWRQLFLIIFVLNVGITACYSVFPVLHLLQNFTPISYFRVEGWFIIASFVAKSFLTITVMAATIQRA